MKISKKQILYRGVIVVMVTLIGFIFYSRRTWKIEVQGNLLSVHNGKVYLFTPDRADCIISTVSSNSQKPQEFLRLPVEKTEPTSFVFDADFLYYFQGQRNLTGYQDWTVWDDGAIYRVPLSGGKPELIVSSVRKSLFAVLLSSIYHIEPVPPKNKTVHINESCLIATDLQTQRNRTIKSRYNTVSKPCSYGKGILWREYDQKFQKTFLILYEQETSLSKRFGPYYTIILPAQTRQDAFWITQNTATDVYHIHRFDSSTGSETETILSEDNGYIGQATPLSNGNILFFRSLSSSQRTSSSSNAGESVNVELLEYPFAHKPRIITRLASLPSSFCADDDWFYYVTLEVESDWMNFSSDNQLKSKSWLKRVKIPH